MNSALSAGHVLDHGGRKRIRKEILDVLVLHVSLVVQGSVGFHLIPFTLAQHFGQFTISHENTGGPPHIAEPFMAWAWNMVFGASNRSCRLWLSARSIVQLAVPVVVVDRVRHHRTTLAANLDIDAWILSRLDAQWIPHLVVVVVPHWDGWKLLAHRGLLDSFDLFATIRCSPFFANTNSIVENIELP